MIDQRRKLVPIPFACVMLGLDEDETLVHVENHLLYPSFNLATSADGRRKIHIYSKAILQFQPGQKPGDSSQLSLVITAILPPLGMTPPGKARIRRTELSRNWCVSPETLTNLIRAKELCEVGHRSFRNDTLFIGYTSAASFLERRVL
jgi:hypothetical protein